MRQKTMPILAICLCASLLLAGFAALADSPLAPRPADLPADEAEAIGWACMREQSGLTADEIAAFQCHVRDLWPDGPADDSTRYWIIGFTDGRFEFSVDVDAQDGHVRAWGPTDIASVHRDAAARAAALADAETARAQWEAEKGPWEFWSAEDKGLFSQQNPGWVRRDIPGPDTMREDEARAIARDALAVTLLVDDAYLDSFRLDTGYVQAWIWEMDAAPQPCWIVAFRPAQPMQDGGYALVHQVTINAETGEAAVFLFNDKTDQPVTGDTYRDTMYYSPDGGIFFHHDADCAYDASEQKPLTAFTRGDPIRQEPLQRLLPCHDCVLHEV